MYLIIVEHYIFLKQLILTLYYYNQLPASIKLVQIKIVFQLIEHIIKLNA